MDFIKIYNRKKVWKQYRHVSLQYFNLFDKNVLELEKKFK